MPRLLPILAPWAFTARVLWRVLRVVWPGIWALSFAALWACVGFLAALVYLGHRVEI